MTKISHISFVEVSMIMPIFASSLNFSPMKSRILLAVLLLTNLLSKAQTIEVSGIQSGVWDADTVLVTGNVTVNDVLVINPGTTVLFNDFFSIHVEEDASIEAIGTEADSIRFTVADTTGFHLFNMGRGGWNGIRLSGAAGSKFAYCRFQYGKAALDNDQDGGALRIYDCKDIEIGHSTLFCNFSREHGGALNAEHSTVKMHDCAVNNNLTYTMIDTVYFMYGGGLRFINCEVELTDTDFRYNDGRSAIGGAMSIDSCSAKIDRCVFEHNHGVNGAGLYMIRCYDNPCSITNSLFALNTSEHFGGGLAISDSSPLVANLTVADNHSIGVNCGGIFFYQHSSPVLWNCIVYGNTNYAQLEKPVQMWSWTYDEHAPEFHNCLVQYGLDNISNHEIITVYENCIDEDPLFNGIAPDEYTIWLNSPCFNAGAPDTPAEILEGLDLYGQPRVYDGIVDIGAIEVDPTGVQENTEKQSRIRIAGNPITAQSYAEIDLDEACNLSAKVYSIDGKMLAYKNLGRFLKGTNHIAIGGLFSSMPSGTYILVIQAADKTFVAKAIR